MIKITDNDNQLFIFDPEDVDSIRSKTSNTCVVSLESGIFFDINLPAERVAELCALEFDDDE